MKINWFLISLISALISGLIAFFITNNWTLTLITIVIVFIIVLKSNPNFRYLYAFYIVLFPLLSDFYFQLELINENLDIQTGIEKMNWSKILILGFIAIACLILDFLQRNYKLKGTFLELNFFSNKIGDISGSNNEVNQNNLK